MKSDLVGKDVVTSGMGSTIQEEKHALNITSGDNLNK